MTLDLNDYVTFGLLAGTLGVCAAAAFDAYSTARIRARRKQGIDTSKARAAAGTTAAFAARAAKIAARSPDP